MTLQFSSRIQAALSEREHLGLTRSPNAIYGGNKAHAEFKGKRFLNFSSNDYLGLACDKELVEAWQEGLNIYGAGSGASPLVTGFSPAHENLQSVLCEWLGYERAVLFGSGFSANQALLFTLLTKNDQLIQDKLNHASLMEAGILTEATMKRFKHNDVNHLSNQLSECENSLVVTEGVFSMDGDLSPLSAIQEVILDKAWLMVDDAHGIGVLGEYGTGSCNLAGIKPEILVITFGKAFGLSGAAILCSDEVGNYLSQFARHYVYSTSIPPAQAHAISYAAKLIQTQDWRREKLQELSLAYDEQMKAVEGYVTTPTPIKPLIIGSTSHALEVSNRLRNGGLWMTAIRPPTVPQGTARLRITLTANHSLEDVSLLTRTLKQAMEFQS